MLGIRIRGTRLSSAVIIIAGVVGSQVVRLKSNKKQKLF
jgi:hypothetical protein